MFCFIGGTLTQVKHNIGVLRTEGRFRTAQRPRVASPPSIATSFGCCEKRFIAVLLANFTIP